MNIHTLIAGLADPTAYPHAVSDVIVHQTHISAVFLAGPFAYKVKKPVRLGFLDFSTLELRHHFCEQEVRLNRRLAPHVYLGVVPVVAIGNRLRFEGAGEPLDWAVKMVRLPDDASLLARLRRHDVSPGDMAHLGRFLAAFHQSAEAGDHVSAFGRFEVVAGNARENFSQTETHVGTAVSQSVFDRVRALNDDALHRLRPLIEDRAARGVPRDTHGDLHLDHVYFRDDGEPFAIDCIEFNERFRFADPIADLAFLVMDLKFHEFQTRGLIPRGSLVAALVGSYFATSCDRDGHELLPFYTAYRAVIRAKVDGIKQSDPEIPAGEKITAAGRAKGRWLLALAELEDPARRPALVLVGGLPGTGKSTLARGLATAAGFEVIRSDVVRKELAEVAPETRLGDAGYTAEHTERTYRECLRRAEGALFEGRRVIVDATFREEHWRKALVALAGRLCVPALLLVCEARPEVVRERLASRTGDASDAGWDIYHRVAEGWETASPGIAADLVAVRTDSEADPLRIALQSLRGRELFV